MLGVKVHACAHYVPPRIVSNEEVGTWTDTTDEWIVRRTGISQRHMSEGENTSDLCIKVAEQLLEKSGMAADDMDLILVTTVSPDYLSPSVSCLVQRAICAKNAIAMDINAACTGFVFGLSVAQKYLASGLYNKVMLIGAEVLTKHVDWTDRNTCILFGDGAGGVILSADSSKFYAEKLRSRGDMPITMAYQDVHNPFCDQERRIDYIKVDGREVFEFAVKNVSENICDLLQANDMTMADITYIIPHQANKRIVEGICKKIGTDMSKFFVNIHKYGNTSSASIPIALNEMLEDGLIAMGRGDKIMMSGFGGGLTWGSVIIEL